MSTVRVKYLNDSVQNEKMKEIQKHITTKWEVSIMEFENDKKHQFKVTQNIPELSVSKTKYPIQKKKQRNRVVNLSKQQ